MRLRKEPLASKRYPIDSMPSTLSPDQVLRRILKISRLNGWSVVLFAGICTLVTLLLGDVTGIVVGALVTGAGLLEVRGNRLLARRHADGMRWLIRAQLFLLAVILIYASSRIYSLGQELTPANLSPEMRSLLTQSGLEPNEVLPLLRTVISSFYGAVMLTTCLYQGGLAFYYRRRRAIVEQALARAATGEGKGSRT